MNLKKKKPKQFPMNHTQHIQSIIFNANTTEQNFKNKHASAFECASHPIPIIYENEFRIIVFSSIYYDNNNDNNDDDTIFLLVYYGSASSETVKY